jgi:hypothetical protein
VNLSSEIAVDYLLIHELLYLWRSAFVVREVGIEINIPTFLLSFD